MKILQLASGDLWAGAEVQLFHLVVALNRIPEATVDVVLFNHGLLETELASRGIRVHVVDETKFSSFTVIRKLNKIVGELTPDIIHSHRFKENIFAGLVALRHGCKSVRTVHGDMETKLGRWDVRRHIIHLSDRMAARYLQQKIISVSYDLSLKLKKIYGDSKITVINNSVNIPHIEQMALEAIDTGISSQHINIGFVGRFTDVKRPLLFCQVAQYVIENESANKVHFYMLGDGPLWDEVSHFITTNQLDNRVHLTGFVKNSAPYLKQLDYLLFTSEHEGLPMVLLEAMALHTSILSTNLVSLKSVLNENQAGYFSDSDNPERIGDLVISVIQEEKIAQKKSDIAKSILASEYSIDENINKYLQIYRSLLN